MSAAFKRAELGLRALYELYLLDDGLDDLVEAAERALETVEVSA
jgi:hypothetical protein